MKDNTYIIPAIDFYVVIPKIKNNQFYSLNDAKQKIIHNDCMFIPFSQVDGLTISELTRCDIGFSRGFAIVALNQLEFKGNNSNYNILDILDITFFPKIEELQSSTMDKRIDKIVEENYELNYTKVDDQGRRIYNSFLNNTKMKVMKKPKIELIDYQVKIKINRYKYKSISISE